MRTKICDSEAKQITCPRDSKIQDKSPRRHHFKNIGKLPRKRVYMKKFFYCIFVLLVSCSFVRAEEYSCLYGNFDPGMTAKEYCNCKYRKYLKQGLQDEIKKLGITTDQWFQVCETSHNENKQEYNKGNCYKIIRTGKTFYRNGKKCEKIKTKEYNMQGFECEDGYSELGVEFGSK